LPEFYRKVLALYYHEGLRVSEIAELTGFCPAHVCQTHTKAILTIRAFVERYERSGRGLTTGSTRGLKTSNPQEVQP
jgi:DNA-directed RNA polymerase specialized sigma24 family protein